jgi:ketosteroid isomerase-like protein
MRRLKLESTIWAMWFRTTLGFRRTVGRWLITHEHGSVPFNPKSGKASLSLKP